MGAVCFNLEMAKISEREFKRIVEGIVEDRESIFRHNPIGTEEETLLWMLMGCLVNYLGLTDNEVPCFPGRPTADTYRQAIEFIIREHGDGRFEADTYLQRLS